MWQRVLSGSGGGAILKQLNLGYSLVVSILGNLYLYGGQYEGNYTINGWTTITTITDSQFIPTNTVFSTVTDANGYCKMGMIDSSGNVRVYSSSSITMQHPVFTGIGTVNTVS